MAIAPRKAPAIRFDRESWLEAALEVLAKEGQARLRVDAIAKSLGVTKGSFYHHFRSREHFVQSLIEYWSRSFNDDVIKAIEELDAPAEDRLLALMQLIDREGLDRYDMAFRSWAAQDPGVAAEIRKVDVARFNFSRAMFKEMGFDGAELDLRVRLFLVYVSAQHTVHIPLTPTNSDAEIRRIHAFFTSRGTI